MTITAAQVQDRLAKLQTLMFDIRYLIDATRQDSTLQGVWIGGPTLTAEQSRVVLSVNRLLTKMQADATLLQ